MNKFRLAKQELCTWCTTLYLNINLFAVTARLCEVKVPNFTFCGGRAHKATIFFLFPWTLMQSFRIQQYWIVLKRKCFFCDARKKEKLTHTHTTTFLNVVCVVSRPLPECSLSVVGLVVFQQGSLNTLQLRFFSVVQSLLLGSKHFRRASLLLSHTVTIPVYIFLFRSSLRLWINQQYLRNYWFQAK